MRERLKNWGAWIRDGKPQQHCYSFEHRYRSPQCWHPPEPRLVIDVRDAERIQAAIVRGINEKLMQPKHSKALHYAYVEYWVNRWKAAQRCGVYIPSALRLTEKEAQELLSKILQQHFAESYHSANLEHVDALLSDTKSMPLAGRGVLVA